ncbi:unnamed protein product [Camellia sinensis]
MPRGRDWTSDGHNGDAVEQGVGEAADLWVAPGPEVATCGWRRGRRSVTFLAMKCQRFERERDHRLVWWMEHEATEVLVGEDGSVVELKVSHS